VSREAFEAWVKSPPYEHDTRRFPMDEDKFSWPGQYQDITVELAWEAWQAASASNADQIRKLREALESLARGIGTCPCRPLATVHGATEVDEWWMKYIAAQDEWVRSIARAALKEAE
jgi:hypothetical protein